MRAVTVLLVAGVALLSAAPAPAATRTVRVYDNFFTPETMNIRSGTTVVWRWPSFEEAGDVHDVKLARGPERVKRFHSEAASTDYSFRRRLKIRGTYRIVCTLHEDMRQTIRVR